MADSTSRSLKQLRTLQRAYDPVSSAEKLSALNRLAPAEMDSAHQVSELHDLLCFLRTYPDNEEVLKLADHMLENFGERADLKRFAPALYDSGIVGTTIHYRFYWQTSLWLYRKWPLQLHIDWSEWEDTHGLDELWPLILPYPAIEALETTLLSSRELIDLLKRDNETDAGYLMRSLLRLAVQDFVKEKYYDDLDVPLRLEPGKSTPSLTRSRRNPPQPVFGYTPATTRVPDFSIMDAAPESVENVSVHVGKRLVDLARVQMITHGRDLYAFMHADPADVRIFGYGHGMVFIGYGLKPDRRSLLESMYIFLIMRNGMPIGYTQAVTLFGSSEINFNVFDTYRGVEASRIFLYTLSMVRHLFGTTTFIINTQQLGEGNEEALQSGAFWFYHKHGFRPADPEVVKLMREELKQRKSRPGYRCSRSVLKKLARSELHLNLGEAREVMVTALPVERIGLEAARLMEGLAGSGDPRGEKRCVAECARLLQYEIGRDQSPGERIAWRRWSPVVLAMPGVKRWGLASKHALVDVINAKGGQRESEFVRLFGRHKLLQKALLKLGRSGSEQ